MNVLQRGQLLLQAGRPSRALHREPKKIMMCLCVSTTKAEELIRILKGYNVVINYCIKYCVSIQVIWNTIN